MRGVLVAVAATSVLLAACGSEAGKDLVEERPAVELPDDDGDDGVDPEPVEPEPDMGVAPLTGAALPVAEAEELSQRPAVAVKVPNDPSARPQSGLEQADVVFEQETEAGVTRFVAVFHSAIPDVVGNVRSARLVDPDLVAPFDGVMVYSGGREEVRERIAAAGLNTVTEGGPGFYRDSARSAPHNLYSRLPEVLSARAELGGPPAVPWRFDSQPPEGGAPLDGRVDVRVSSGYTAGFEFVADEGVFRRYQNGSYHTVTGPDAISAANVVLLDVSVTGRDSHGAPRYAMTGGGDAVLLRDGSRFDIRWEKAGRDAQLQLTDGADRAVLRPGPTWVVLTYDGAISGM